MRGAHATTKAAISSFTHTWALELAEAIDFLLSEEAGYVIGQILFVDGGGLIGRVAI